MNFLIDEAINKLLGLDLVDFKEFVPVTVAEALAFSLMKEALSSEGIKAIQIIADRSGGRAVGVKKENGDDDGFAEKLKRLVGE